MLEVLLAGVLSLLVLAIISWILVPLTRNTRTTTVRAELQQLGSVTMDRMLKHLRQSASVGVSSYADASHTVLAVHPLVDLSSSATQVWSDHLELFLWDRAQSQLRHRPWPPEPPSLGWIPQTTSTRRLTPTEMAGLAGATGPVLAAFVENFTVGGFSPEGVFTPPMELRLELRKENVRFEIAQVVLFRNSARPSGGEP